MALAESSDSMMQGSFIRLGDGDYALKVSELIPEVSKATSVTAFGDVLTPTANQAIATTVPDLAAGTWEVRLYTNQSGSATGVDRPNMNFRVGGVSIATIISSGAGATDMMQIRVNLANPAPVAVYVGAVTPTSGAVYRASIVATRIA